MHLNVVLADKCNLSCKMCTFVKNATGAIMPIERYINILEQCANLSIAGAKVMGMRLDGNREALLYPYLEMALTETKKRGFETSLVTNAVLLTQKTSEMLVEGGLDYIEISATGISAEIYENFQGFGCKDVKEQLKVVGENVRYLANFRNKRGSKMYISVVYLSSDESVKDIDSAVFYWKDKGVDSIRFSGDIYQNEDAIIGGADINYYPGTIICKHKVTVATNGDVYPCCYEPGEKMPLGNCLETSLNKIFASKKYYDFHSSIASLEEDLLPKRCKGCIAIACLDKNVE